MNTQPELSKLNKVIADIFTGIKSNKSTRGQGQVDFTRRQQQLVAMLVDRESEFKRIINSSLRTVGIEIKLKSDVDFKQLLSELKDYSKILANNAVSCTHTLKKSSLSIKEDISANSMLDKLKDYSEDLHSELVWRAYEPGKQPSTAVLLSTLQKFSKGVVYDSETSTYTVSDATLSIKFARQSKLLSKIDFEDLKESAVKKYTALVACLVMIKNSTDPVKAAKDQLLLCCPNILLNIIKPDVIQKDTQLMLDETFNKKPKNNSLQQILLGVASFWLLNICGVPEEIIVVGALISYLLYIAVQLFAQNKSEIKAHIVQDVTEVDEDYEDYADFREKMSLELKTTKQNSYPYNEIRIQPLRVITINNKEAKARKRDDCSEFSYRYFNSQSNVKRQKVDHDVVEVSRAAVI